MAIGSSKQLRFELNHFYKYTYNSSRVRINKTFSVARRHYTSNANYRRDTKEKKTRRVTPVSASIFLPQRHTDCTDLDR